MITMWRTDGEMKEKQKYVDITVRGDKFYKKY